MALAYLHIPRVTVAPLWRSPLLTLVIGLFALCVIYADTLAATTAIWWRSDTFAHGLLVIPFTLYMLWTRRAEFAQSTPAMSWWGIAAMVPGMLVWLVGDAVNVLVIQQLALLGLVWSLVLAVLGPRVVRRMLFPLAFLFFAVPLGEGLIPPLMDFTAIFTVKALQLTGIPVYREGLYFTIPSGNFEVAKACSGVRYLFASVALGSLFAYLNYRSYWRRAVFISFAIALPIVANGVRAYGIVMLAHLSGMRLAVGFDHLIYGWLFFGVIMFVLFFVGARWREQRDAGMSHAAHPAPARTGVSAYLRPAIATGLAGLLLAGLITRMLAQPGLPDTARGVQLQPPDGTQGWTRMADAPPAWEPAFHGASAQLGALYANDAARVGLFMAYYQHEAQDAELISSVNTFYDNRHWTRVDAISRTLSLANGTSIHLQQHVLRSGSGRRLLWYWYDIGGVTVNDNYLGKLLQAWQALSGQAQGNAALAVMLDYSEGQRVQAVATLEAYVRDMYPALQSSLATARGLAP